MLPVTVENQYTGILPVEYVDLPIFVDLDVKRRCEESRFRGDYLGGSGNLEFPDAIGIP